MSLWVQRVLNHSPNDGLSCSDELKIKSLIPLSVKYSPDHDAAAQAKNSHCSSSFPGAPVSRCIIVQYGKVFKKVK